MTENPKSIWCRLFGHYYDKVPNKYSFIPCDRVDDCDIKDHEINRLHWFCNRCNFEKIVRMDSRGFVIQ